jgi:hypothetical protein
MKKAWRLMAAALALLGGCNNFFHELVPPDENRILSFTVPNQRGETAIQDNSLVALAERDTDITALIPEISLSPKAAVLPLTMNYVSAAFHSADLFRTAVDIRSADDLAAYVIELIKANPGFNVPAMDRPIDFTGPVEFLVIGGMGSIRRYTALVSVDTGTAQILHFGFSKYDNPFLMFDAVGFVNEETKTVGMLAVFPAELEPAYTLVPGFELLGETLQADGLEVRPGTDVLAFSASLNSPSPPALQRKALAVHRAGYPSSEYTLQLMSAEDPDTVRSIIDFRFTKADNPGIVATAVASIINNGDRGLIRIQVLYRGVKPAVLKARHVSPGTVTAGGVPQITGLTVNDFSVPLEYRVVSRNGLYSRTYAVETEFIDATEPAPRLLSFRFPADLNGELSQTAIGEINEGAGLVMVEVRHTGAAAPRSLIPEFSATGMVKVSGLTQTSGGGVRDFTRQVKYTVVSPDDSSLYRDYWVQTVFAPDNSGAASITAFSFHPDENPHLAEEAPGRIDQIARTIDLYLPYGANIGTTPLVPRFSAHGKVTVDGSLQASGAGGRLFGQPTLYEVESANGLNHKTYTVRVQELNTRLYVDRDAAGLNNGASWADAFINLRTACETAALFPDHVPREIWIAAGTYAPSQIGDPAASFPLTPNTSYLGGFAGGETAKAQRIPGANPTIISGDLGSGIPSRHLFYGTSLPAGELVFEDLSFAGAKTLAGTGQDYSGAALSVTANGGTVRIQGCTFTDLEADYRGGAVYVNGTGLDLSESGFVACRVPAVYDRHGGAIYVELPNQTAAVNVEEVAFDATSAFRGGAVYIGDNYISNNTIQFSQISLENVSAASSGGIFVNGKKNTVTMSDITVNKMATVTANTCSGIYVSNQNGGTVTISDVEMHNAGILSSTGSGMTYLEDITVVNSSVFENDRIAIYGGADISNVTVDGTWPTMLGAVSLSGPSGGQGMNISGLTIRNITGRGLYISDNSQQPTTISDLSISNTADGGASIFVDGGLSIGDTTVSNTTSSSGSGGGLFVSNTSTQATVISGLAISNTTASIGSGGGAYIGANGSLSIGNTNVSGTQASGPGGGLHIHNYSTQATTISGLTVSNTTASSGSGSGGGACIEVNGSLSIGNTTISGTQARSSGGGLHIYNTSTQATVISGLTVSNTTSSSGSGGGAYIDVNGSLSIGNTNVSGTQASGSGGGAYIIVNGSLYLEDATISGTHANRYGGLYIHNKTLTQPSVISGLRVVNATAASSVGGIGYHNDKSPAGSLLIKDTVISAYAPTSVGASIRNGTGPIASGSGFFVVNTVINGTDRSGSYDGSDHSWN